MESRHAPKEWLGLLVIPLILLASHFILTMNTAEEQLGLADTVVRAVVLVGMLFLFNGMLRDHWQKFKRMTKRKWLFILLGIIGLHVVLMLARMVFPHATEEAVDMASEGVDYLEVSWDYFLIVLIASFSPVITAVIEELTFRYLLLERLLNQSQIWMVILVLLNGILFGALHINNLGSLYNTLPYMAVGIFIATIYTLSRNIWMVILIHLGSNALLSVIPLSFLGIIRLIG